MQIINKLKTLFGKPAAALVPPGSTPNTRYQVQQISDSAQQALLAMLKNVLQDEGVASTQQGKQLRLESGIALQVDLLETHKIAENRVRITTQIIASHAQAFSAGLLEFQHAVGSTEEEALASGFRVWAQLDLVVLQDALLAEPQHCVVMRMEYPPANGASLVREVLLGPINHLSSQPYLPEKEAHPFCTCCLFTRCAPAFDALLRGQELYALRLFAARDEQGQFSGDCRVNGHDFAAGEPYLMEYGSTWPGKGLEFRKQYVLIRNPVNAAA